MSGSSLRAEFLPDRVVVRYHLQKPSGILDEEGTKEVRYEAIALLPPPPTSVGFGERNWLQEFEIPDLGETLVFMFDSFCEKDIGPNEHVLYGPYRKPTPKTPS